MNLTFEGLRSLPWRKIWRYITLSTWIIASISFSQPSEDTLDHTDEASSPDISPYYGPGILLAWMILTLHSLFHQVYISRENDHSESTATRSSGLEALPSILYTLPILIDIFIQKSRGNMAQFKAAQAVLRFAVLFEYVSQAAEIWYHQQRSVSYHAPTYSLGMWMLVWLESKHGAGNKDGDGEGNVKDAVAITQIISFVLLFGPSSCLRIYCYYKTLTWDRKALWVYAKNFAYACVTAGCFIWSAWIVKGLSNMSMLGDSKSSLVWIESSRDLPISKSKWYDLDQVMAIVAAALAVILAWRKKVLTMLTESIRIRKIVYCIRKRLWLGREGMLEELPASEMVELEAQSQTLELASYPRERHEHSLQVELPAIVPFYELE